MDKKRDQVKLESSYFNSSMDCKKNYFDDEEEDCLQIAEDSYQGEYVPQKIELEEEEDRDEICENDEEADKMLSDVRYLLATTKVYMNFIDGLIKKVTSALDLNQKLQKTVEAGLNVRIIPSNVSKRSPLSLVPCLPPYFKDQFGMIPAWNVDTHSLSLVYPVDPLMTTQQKWNPDDRELLVDAVSKSLRGILLSPVVKKKKLVAQRLKASGVDITDEQREIWLTEIETISRRISYLKGLSDIEVLLQIGDKDVDWERISAVEFKGSRSALQLRMKWSNDASRIFYQGEWRPKEDEFLQGLLGDVDTEAQISWGDVAADLRTSRAPYHCFERFLLLQRQQSGKDMWSADEDKTLIELVAQYTLRGTVNWNKVCAFLPKRSKDQCEYHYKRCLKASHSHGRWTLEEDLELFKLINRYGPQDWQGVATHLNKRSSLQCRDRWMNVLDPKRRNEPWLWEEHKRLFFGVEIFGRNNPAKIALLLPGRNNSDVKARITALKRFKMMVFEAQEDNREEPTYELAASNYKFNKARREKVLNTFREQAENNEADEGEDRNSLNLSSRVGLGSYIITSFGNQVDYSEVKLNRSEVFGKSLGRSGRWVQFRKNPNEYGNEELDIALKELSSFESKRVLKFLNHSNRRYAKEVEQEKACGDDLDEQFDFYSSIITDARMKELKRQIDRLLPIGRTDVERRAERRINYLKSGATQNGEDVSVKKTKRGRPRKRLKCFKDYAYENIIGC